MRWFAGLIYVEFCNALEMTSSTRVLFCPKVSQKFDHVYILLRFMMHIVISKIQKYPCRKVKKLCLWFVSGFTGNIRPKEFYFYAYCTSQMENNSTVSLFFIFQQFASRTFLKIQFLQVNPKQEMIFFRNFEFVILRPGL